MAGVVRDTAFIRPHGTTQRYLGVTKTHPANFLVKDEPADHDTDMLLPVWVLFTLSAGLGVLGLVMAYKRNWVAIVPVLAVLAIAAATIVQLRDPLSLAPQYRRATHNWGYIAMLFWSVVLGVTLPVIGSYLGARRKR
jgi:hypothetical protein